MTNHKAWAALVMAEEINQIVIEINFYKNLV